MKAIPASLDKVLFYFCIIVVTFLLSPLHARSLFGLVKDVYIIEISVRLENLLFSEY